MPCSLKGEPDMYITNSTKKQNALYFQKFHSACFCISINRMIKFQFLYDPKAQGGGSPWDNSIKHKSSMERNLMYNFEDSF